MPTTGKNVRAGEKPPVEPVLATQHTLAGAAAFSKFFIQTIDWGYATTNGAYPRHYYTSACIGCSNQADGIDRTRAAGNYYVGGRLQVVSSQATGTVAARERR